MHVVRLSLTPLKGTAHTHPSRLVFDLDGPRDDRRFCLVDPARGRVLRTVENPRLVACRASYDGTRLSVRLPDGSLAAGTVTSGSEQLTVDYWGRCASVSVAEGPWAAAFSTFIGHPVVLCEVERAGQVVFGGSVTLLSTSSLREVARRLGQVIDAEAMLADSERFRSTVVVDTGDAQPFVEDGWLGHELTVGDAVVRVRGAVPRCAVVGVVPRVGRRDGSDPLRALAPDRTEVNERGREVVFGVQADVLRPGVVSLGDTVQGS